MTNEWLTGADSRGGWVPWFPNGNISYSKNSAKKLLKEKENETNQVAPSQSPVLDPPLLLTEEKTEKIAVR